MFRELRPGLFLQTSLLYQTQSVIVADSDAVTAIDPCFFPPEVDAARSLFDRCGAHGRERLLVLTHSDFDHIVGVPRFPDARVVTSGQWDLANERRSRTRLRRFDEQFYIERDAPLERPVGRDRSIASDGEALVQFLCYLAPGHTGDGLVLFHRPTSCLIVGDYLSDCEFPFVAQSALRYRETLAKLRRLAVRFAPDLLISQHGPPAFGQRAIAARLDESERYLDALLESARLGGTARDVARRAAGAWRTAIPRSLAKEHLCNAGIALQELS